MMHGQQNVKFIVKSERSVLFKKETRQFVSSYLFSVGMWILESFSIERRMQSAKMCCWK